MTKAILFSLAVIFSCSAIRAQTNFSGVWTINKSKISFGEAPENVLPKGFTVLQGDSQIMITRILLDEKNEEHPFSETMTFDGKEVTNTTYNNVNRTTSVKPGDDANTFILTSHGVMADNKPAKSWTEAWSLQDGGNTLVIDRVTEQADGFKYTLKAFYEKK